jgi:hypothetical protein
VTQSSDGVAAHQGFAAADTGRLPLPAREVMTDTQRAAAEAIIAGPRKAIFGPFVALLQCPPLMEFRPRPEWLACRPIRTGDAAGRLAEQPKEVADCRGL